MTTPSRRLLPPHLLIAPLGVDCKFAVSYNKKKLHISVFTVSSVFNEPRVYCCICIQVNVKPQRRTNNVLKKALEEYFKDEVWSEQKWASRVFFKWMLHI
jgi:hypothetical protein